MRRAVSPSWHHTGQQGFAERREARSARRCATSQCRRSRSVGGQRRKQGRRERAGARHGCELLRGRRDTAFKLHSELLPPCCSVQGIPAASRDCELAGSEDCEAPVFDSREQVAAALHHLWLALPALAGDRQS